MKVMKSFWVRYSKRFSLMLSLLLPFCFFVYFSAEKWLSIAHNNNNNNNKNNDRDSSCESNRGDNNFDISVNLKTANLLLNKVVQKCVWNPFKHLRWSFLRILSVFLVRLCCITVENHQSDNGVFTTNNSDQSITKNIMTRLNLVIYVLGRSVTHTYCISTWCNQLFIVLMFCVGPALLCLYAV